MSRFPLVNFLFLLGLSSPGAAQDEQPAPTNGPDLIEAAVSAPLETPKTGVEAGTDVDDRELEAFVDGVVATWRSLHGAPGYTVAVVRPDQTVFTKGYGLADVEQAVPVDPEHTRFHVASISKTFVWTAVLLLVDQGVLELDRDVNDYLKRYSVPPGDRPLTLNDLMSHRGGFEDNFTLFSTQAAAMDLPQAIAYTEPKQVFPRGEVAAYSNWGSNLTALIVEEAAGQPYADFLLEEILIPLGMLNTALTEESPAAQKAENPLSQNFTVNDGGPKVLDQLDLGAFAPVAGMTTTATDMARWMRFHLGRGALDGVRLMSQDSYATLRSRAFDPVPGAAGRAHGFADLPYRDVSYYGHTGSINAFYSKFSVSPELGLGVFIAQNTSDDFDPLSSMPRLVFDRALQQRGAADVLLRPEPSEHDVAAAEAIAGTYISARRIFHGVEKVLFAMDSTQELWAENGRLLTAGGSPYVQVLPDVWENRHGDRLAVIRNDQGEVKSLLTPYGDTEMIRVTPLTNPQLLVAAVGATLLLTLTAWLGAWRRWRQQKEPTATGRRLTLLTLFGAAPILLMGLIVANAPSPETTSFAEIFSDWPLPFFAQLALAATGATVVAAIATLGLWPAWRTSGWTPWRKVHYSLYALAYLAAGLLFINWGMVPG